MSRRTLEKVLENLKTIKALCAEEEKSGLDRAIAMVNRLLDDIPKEKFTPPKKNPHKRPCVARNITFPVEAENRKLLKWLKSF
jgi:hypothetical protein